MAALAETPASTHCVIRSRNLPSSRRSIRTKRVLFSTNVEYYYERGQVRKALTTHCGTLAYDVGMTHTDAVVAANVRARLAWSGYTLSSLAPLVGMSQQSLSNKVRALRSFSADELARIAGVLGLADPGPFYRIPDGFGEPIVEVAAPSWSPLGAGQRHLRAVA